MGKKPLLLSIVLSLFIVPLSAVSAQKLSWNQWVSNFRQEAVADGISPQFFDEVFKDIKKPHRKTISLDRNQPETRLTYLKYRNSRGDAYRIKLGVSKYKKHRQMIDQIAAEYGVDPCIIMSLWGIETSYGHYMGSFPVIQSLASLAYDNRRGKFFKKQLLLALHIVQDGHVSLADYKGEWAGGSGHPQFLPSSWYNYAVDYDQDGYKDIWKTKSDAFASIANYMRTNGWHPNEPWYVEVDVPYNLDPSLLGKENKRTVGDWEAMGVRIRPGQQLPSPTLEAAIVEPYGGPHLMIFHNFGVIRRYNNSLFYAGTVGYIADSICKKANR